MVGNHEDRFSHDTAYFYSISDSHRAVQALECMGLISLGVAVLIILLFLFIDGMRRRSPLIAIIVFTFAAGEYIEGGVRSMP